MIPLLLTLLACDTPTPEASVPEVQPAELAEAAARVFCAAATQADIACTAAGAVAGLGDTAVTMTAELDSSLVLPPKKLGMGSAAQTVPGEVQLAARIGVAIGATPLMTVLVEAAGSGTDVPEARAAAIEAVAQRWMVGTGLAVLDAQTGGARALAAVGMDVPPTAIGATGFTGHAAYPILKGRGFDPKMAARLGPSVKTMVAGLAPYLEGVEADGPHAIRVHAQLGGGSGNGPCPIIPPVSMTPGETVSLVPLSGTVEVDGIPKGDPCALAEAVAWPLPRDGAVLEWDQVVVVVPGAG